MLSSENQNTEYKRTWSDEYLKWICGFANAQGGRIYIGVADDRTVIGLTDTELHRLSEDTRGICCRQPADADLRRDLRRNTGDYSPSPARKGRFCPSRCPSRCLSRQFCFETNDIGYDTERR